MRIQSIKETSLKPSWEFLNKKSSIEGIDLYNQKQVLDHFAPWVSISAKQIYRNDETTYREITSLIDGNFLNQAVRAEELRGVQVIGFRDNIMNFYVPSSKFEQNRIRYTNSVLFEQWDSIGTDTELTFAEKARMLLWVGDIKLHCTCPSFQFHGYVWILSILDAAIYPEQRRPVIRNPQERGVVCKHGNRLLKALPFHLGDIARELKRQFG
jgi:hypothetical protein